ncbi:hypothetical protein NDU88_005083 [Pleurodeles waltl]|uniref:Secreted protein n=1 Tax=Pleurodeles waltl TaxID=8319 RepID=A0AAV7TUF3_PLEWA|nr:hypothetical protein NDU88_005083 [Pleurodeles waltl]
MFDWFRIPSIQLRYPTAFVFCFAFTVCGSGLSLVKAAAGRLSLLAVAAQRSAGRREDSVCWPLRLNAVLLSCCGVERQFSFRSFRPGLVRESGRGVCGGPARCGRTGELSRRLAAIQPA